MDKFAIIETGGKQYKVSAGEKLRAEKLGVADGGVFDFDKVLLLVDGGEIKIGRPYIENAKIEAAVIRQARDKKKIIFKYHSKTRHRRKKGHRQPYTEVQIKKI